MSEEVLLKKRRQASPIAARNSKKAPNKEQAQEPEEGGSQVPSQDQMNE